MGYVFRRSTAFRVPRRTKRRSEILRQERHRAERQHSKYFSKEETSINLFAQIKTAVSLKEAAEHYGLKIGRSDMVCCPFHNDHTPSMKLNEDYFYCFAPVYEECEEKGKTMLVREVNENATDFSGGEKQKLLFARALYKQSKLLILDEPTAALDPIAENKLYQNFGKAAGNNTVIFISHRLSSTRFCDRIILLEGAQISEEGTHEQLMSQKGRYAELFEIQSKYYRETGLNSNLTNSMQNNQEEGRVYE